MNETIPSTPDSGWRRSRGAASLPEIHASIPVNAGHSWWRRMLAFAGPGFMVAVGYMDPGNWATDLAGGSKFGYALLSVILLSNLMAMLMQHLAVKLGVVTERGMRLPTSCLSMFRPSAIQAEETIAMTEPKNTLGMISTACFFNRCRYL